MKTYLTTNGCSLARLKTMQLREFLRRNDPSVQFVETPTEAGRAMIFACGLTEMSERSSCRLIHQVRRDLPHSSDLVAWGCLPRINPELARHLYPGPLVGPRDEEFFDRYVDHVEVPFAEVSANSLIEQTDRFCGVRYRPSPFDAALHRASRLFDRLTHHGPMGEVFYIRVADGCLGRCSYCAEKMAWGDLESRPVEAILREFADGLDRGYTRFFLCSEDLGAYGLDIGLTCPQLLREIIDAFAGRTYRMIIDQITPQFLIRYLEDLRPILSTGRIETIGCQVQSGSDRVLRHMRRPYKARQWRSTMMRLAAEFPSVRLQTHFMVGFPGETKADFRATLRLLSWPMFIRSCNVYVFSAKDGVSAASFPDQVSERTKLRRRARVFRKQILMSWVCRLSGRRIRARAALAALASSKAPRRTD